MEIVNINFKPNELIESKFDTKFHCISDNEVEIHFKKNGNFEMIRTTTNIAKLYYHIINLITEANPNLVCQYILYKGKESCVSYSKRVFNLYDPILQHDALWVFFQKTAIKIQLSMSIKVQFNLFYEKHKVEFNKLFNSNDEQVKGILNGKNNPDTKHINKITRYKSGTVHDWLNFNLVNTEPLPLLFEFIKDLKIIKPI